MIIIIIVFIYTYVHIYINIHIIIIIYLHVYIQYIYCIFIYLLLYLPVLYGCFVNILHFDPHRLLLLLSVSLQHLLQSFYPCLPVCHLCLPPSLASGPSRAQAGSPEEEQTSDCLQNLSADHSVYHGTISRWQMIGWILLFKPSTLSGSCHGITHLVSGHILSLDRHKRGTLVCDMQ